MKTHSILLLIFLTAFTENLNAQCEVDAGGNVHLCIDEETGIRDSGRLTATVLSGVHPFDFKWETKHYLWDNQYRYASDFLDDTTSASPNIYSIHPSNELIIFQLTATDSLGNTCVDSVTISLSVFHSLSVDIGEAVIQGDTVKSGWFRIFGDFEPLSVAWTPNYNISNTTVFYPSFWADTSLVYEILITDSVGCTIKDYFPLEVLTVGTENRFIGTEYFKTYPNPNKGIFFFEKTDKSPMSGTLKLTDSSGKVVFLKKVENQIRGEIDFPNLTSGNYFIQLFEKEKVLVGQIFIE